MNKLAPKTFQCFLVSVFMMLQISANSDMWMKILFNVDFFDNDPLAENFKTSSKVLCGSLCSQRYYCNIWCYDELMTCDLSSTMVSPSYIGKDDDSSQCYIRKRRDLVVGSIAYSSELSSNDTNSELTTDGVFLSDFGNVFETSETEYPWVLYDLKNPAIINEIRITTENTSDICSKLVIIVGKSVDENNILDDYESFTTNEDYCVLEQKTTNFKPSTLITGPYVAVIYKGWGKLSFNHIEIDGEFYQAPTTTSTFPTTDIETTDFGLLSNMIGK